MIFVTSKYSQLGKMRQWRKNQKKKQKFKAFKEEISNASEEGHGN